MIVSVNLNVVHADTNDHFGENVFVDIAGAPITRITEYDDYRSLNLFDNLFIVLQVKDNRIEKSSLRESFRSTKDKDVYTQDLINLYEKWNEKYTDRITNKHHIISSDIEYSKFTPFIFIKSTDSYNLIDLAIDLSKEKWVEKVYIYEDIEFVAPAAPPCLIGPDGECVSSEPPPPVDNRTDIYDNFPTGTQYTGDGIKIGILDTGGFNENHINFDDIYVETVVDTANANDNIDHPDIVASVLGGEFGVASDASLYYADVNSDLGFSNIEDLLIEQVDVINMSIEANSCYSNGNYDSFNEAYLDYIGYTELVILVAATGNTLDKAFSGGFVCQPANSANVISVGSIDITGDPSHFSSYMNKNNVSNNPVISAVGENRLIEGFGFRSGTSYSAPAVAGTIALLLEKHGYLSKYNVETILTVTSDNSIIGTANEVIDILVETSPGSGTYIDSGSNYTVPENSYDDSIGFNPRTGSGALDIEAALNYSGPIVDYCLTGMIMNQVEPIVVINASAGEEIVVSLAWERIADYDPGASIEYTIDDIVDFSLRIINDSGVLVSQTTVVESTHEMIRYTIPSNGTYTLEFKAISDATTIVNFAYSFIVIQ